MLDQVRFTLTLLEVFLGRFKAELSNATDPTQSMVALTNALADGFVTIAETIGVAFLDDCDESILIESLRAAGADNNMLREIIIARRERHDTCTPGTPEHATCTPVKPYSRVNLDEVAPLMPSTTASPSYPGQYL